MLVAIAVIYLKFKIVIKYINMPCGIYLDDKMCNVVHAQQQNPKYNFPYK